MCWYSIRSTYLLLAIGTLNQVSIFNAAPGYVPTVGIRCSSDIMPHLLAIEECQLLVRRKEFNSFTWKVLYPLFFNSATFNGFVVLQVTEVARLISNLKNMHAFFKTQLLSRSFMNSQKYSIHPNNLVSVAQCDCISVSSKAPQDQVQCLVRDRSKQLEREGFQVVTAYTILENR